MLFDKPAYRTRQVLHALFPRLDDGHHERARALLSEPEMRLFLSMERRDQRHGLRVLDHLVADGETDPHLLTAALLHDCGKGRVQLRLRITYVVWPRYVEHLASGGRGIGSHEAAYRLVNHPELGARVAEAAGASAATIRYISGRVAEHEHDKISSLRAADDRS